MKLSTVAALINGIVWGILVAACGFYVPHNWQGWALIIAGTITLQVGRSIK